MTNSPMPILQSLVKDHLVEREVWKVLILLGVDSAVPSLLDLRDARKMGLVGERHA